MFWINTKDDAGYGRGFGMIYGGRSPWIADQVGHDKRKMAAIREKSRARCRRYRAAVRGKGIIVHDAVASTR